MIPLSVPNIKGNELKYLTQCVKTEFVSSVGKFVNLFENKISKYTGSKYAVACSSGTSALQLALRILGVKQNDEVIVPSMTFIATVNSIMYLGAKPVFMDCDEYYNLDIKKLSNFLKNKTFIKNGFTFNKKSKRKISAIIPVHVSGNAVELKKLVAECQKRKIKVVEDAAESLGTFYNSGSLRKKHTGTIGNVGCLSFNGNKIITSGGGGMILTNEKKLAKYAKYLSTQATDDPINYVHNDIGYNFRLTNVQAAVGLAQLEKINYFLKKKRELYRFYQKNFKSMKNLNFAPVPKYATNNCWMMSVILKKGSDKKKLINYLRRKKIQTRSIWQPCHMQKPYKFFESYKIVNAENLFKRTVNIPCSTNLSLNQARLVIKFIKNFYKVSK